MAKKVVVVLPENEQDHHSETLDRLDPLPLANYLKKMTLFYWSEVDLVQVIGSAEAMNQIQNGADAIIFIGSQYMALAGNLIRDRVGLRIVVIAESLPNDQIITLLPEWIALGAHGIRFLQDIVEEA